MEDVRSFGEGNQAKSEGAAMNNERLLAWMTHMGGGSWAGFRKAAEEIFGSDRDPLDLCRSLRVGLSDLGFADFFIDGTQQWRMLPPVLGGLAVHQNAAALYGSRTPRLVEELRNAAGSLGGRFESEDFQDCPTSFRVVGGREVISAIADRIGVAYEPDNARRIAESVPPIPFMLEGAAEEPAPLNWKARSFDIDKCQWVDGLLSNAACEFTPTYGHSRYYVRRKSGKLLRIPKRESIYAAALLKGVRLIDYEPSAMRLSAPLSAPLPELYARAACLCACRPPEINNGRFVYHEVTPIVAVFLMVAAGQPHPGAAVLAAGAR